MTPINLAPLLLSVLISMPQLSAQQESTSGGPEKVAPTNGRAERGGFPSECAVSLRDQSMPDACMRASSAPTLGLLFPYPGTDNTFSPTAFIGGGQLNSATAAHATIGGGISNQATGLYSTIAGGRQNEAAGIQTM